MKKITTIVPCFNEQEALPHFYKEITKVAKQMKNIDFEFCIKLPKLVILTNGIVNNTIINTTSCINLFPDTVNAKVEQIYKNAYASDIVSAISNINFILNRESPTETI